MREAIGNTFITNIVVVFMIIMISFFVGSLSYSKAYKVKNRILSIIESDGSWKNHSEEVDSILKEYGYQVTRGTHTCECKKDNCRVLHDNTNNYEYCVFEYTDGADGIYYGVKTFMNFDIPVIGKYIKFGVYGETKTFNDFN